MKLGIMQPYFFPYIGYWQLINAVDKYVICDDLNYIKGGWINRNRILSNGEAKMVNLHMKGASQNKHINEIETLREGIYNKNLLSTLKSCYIKAPFYSNVFPVLENIINQDEKNLAKYLEFSIRQICEYLSIDTQIIVSSTINKNNDLKNKDKVIEICQLLHGDEYINAIDGQELYSYHCFATHNIKLSFLKDKSAKYKQFNNEFVESLSIIDVMMFNSKYQIKNMLEEYQLLRGFKGDK